MPATVKLHPEFDKILRQLEAEMRRQGHPIKIGSTVRSADEQRKLWMQGRGEPGKIITEKSGEPGDESLHQSGRAADIDFIDKENWPLLGQTAKRLGLEWGGDWKSLVDSRHVQYPESTTVPSVPSTSTGTPAPTPAKPPPVVARGFTQPPPSKDITLPAEGPPEAPPAKRYSFNQFAEAIRATNPDLAHVEDDGLLTHAVLATHPEFQDVTIDPLEGAPYNPSQQKLSIRQPGGPPPVPPPPDDQMAPDALPPGRMMPPGEHAETAPLDSASMLGREAVAAAVKSPVTGPLRMAHGFATLTAGVPPPGVRPAGTPPPLTLREAAGGLGNMVGGAMETGTFLLPEMIASAPLKTGIELATAAVAGYGTQKGLTAAGAPPEYSDLAGDIAAIATGVGAGHMVEGRTGRRTAAINDQLASENAAAAGDTAREQGLQESWMHSDLAAARQELDSEAFTAAQSRARLNVAAQMNKARPGTAFDYLTQLQALGEAPVPPPNLDILRSFQETPGALGPPKPPQLALPPARTTMVGAPGVMDEGTLESVGQGGPPIVASSRPFPELVQTLGEQLGSQLENQPTQPPRPAEATRVKFRERQRYRDMATQVLGETVDQMEGIPYQRGRLVNDLTTGETYYTPHVGGADVYWQIVGRKNEHPPTRAVITDVLRAYRDTGAAAVKDLPEGYKPANSSDLGERAFHNAYDTWVPEIKKVVDRTARQRIWYEDTQGPPASGVEQAAEGSPAVGEEGTIPSAPPSPSGDSLGTTATGELGPPPVPQINTATIEHTPDWVKENIYQPEAAEGGWEPEEGGPPPTMKSIAAQTAQAPPPVAELPFSLEKPATSTKPAAQPSLWDKFAGEEGYLIFNVKPGDKKALYSWLKKNEAEHGGQDWFQEMSDALDQGDVGTAWRIGAIAAARSFAGAVGGNAQKAKEGALLPTAIKADKERRAYIEKQIGYKLPDTVDVSPEGVVTFDFGGNGIPAVKARATDLMLGRTFLADLTNAADPSDIIKIEGNTDPNLRVNAQIADQIVREMPREVLDPLLELTGIKDDVELGRQYRRAFSDAGRRLQILSQYVQENDDLFTHIRPISGGSGEQDVVGLSSAATPDGFVKWLNTTATQKDLDLLNFKLPKGIDLKNAKGEVTIEAKTYARNWFRRQQKLAELQKTVDALAKNGSALDRALITTTLAPDIEGKGESSLQKVVNVSRAMLIAKPATMIRNFWTQGGRYVSGVIDDVLAGGFSTLTGDLDQAKMHFTEAKNLMAGTVREGTSSHHLFKHPWADGLQAIYDLKNEAIAGMDAKDARKSLALLGEFPKWESNFLGSLMLEGRPQEAGTIKQATNTITVLNRFQEHFYRATVFDSVFRTQLELKGLDPEVELAGDPHNLVQKLGEEEVDRMIGAGVSAALDYTFAANPFPGTVPDMLMNVFSRHPIFAPLLQAFVAPFPRFNFVSAPRWLWDHFPLAPVADYSLYQLSRFREDASPAARGRYYMMKEMEQQGVVLPKLDGEIGRTEYDAAGHLQRFMQAKDDAKQAAKAFKALEGRASKEGMLPEIHDQIVQVGNDLQAQIATADQAKQQWREAEARITNLKGQRDKARQTYTNLQMVGAARSPQEYYARITQGAAMFGAAYMIRQQMYDLGQKAVDKATKWYEYYMNIQDLPGMPGHPALFDLRAYAPQVQPLLLADLAVDIEHNTDWSGLSQAMKDAKGQLGGHFWSDYMQKHYSGKYTAPEFFKDALEAYLSVSPAAGSTKTLIDALTGRAGEGEPLDVGGVQDALISTMGQFIGRFTAPLGAISDVAGQFRPEEAAARIPEEGTPEQHSLLRSVVDPTLANIPGVREVIPEKVSPMSGKPIQTLDPLARALAGVTQRTQTQVEGEIKRTGLPYGAAVPRVTGDREFDNKVATAYAHLLDENFGDVLGDEEYQKLTPELRRDILAQVFRGIKQGAYGAVADEVGEELAHARLQTPKAKQKLERWQGYLDKEMQALAKDQQPEPEEREPAEAGAPPRVSF